MPQVDKTPPNLKPYINHGIDLTWGNNDDNAIGECPFCDHEGKFSVHIESGKFRCFSCNAGEDTGKAIRGGNPHWFIRELWRLSEESTTKESLIGLSKLRGFLDHKVLSDWGVVKSRINGTWLVPGYGTNGNLNQLYRWVSLNNHLTLIPTATLGHQLHGANNFDSAKSVVYLFEGPWDAIAAYEVLSVNGELDDANILAVPGCGTMLDAWLPLFEGKIVYIMFDSDHPKIRNGIVHPPAGFRGSQTITEALTSGSTPPSEIYYMDWGPEGYDPQLPDGYDIRDALRKSDTHAGRELEWITLYNTLNGVPGEWVREPGEVGEKFESLTTLPCSSYKELKNAWKKAMKWIDGLDHALVSMLASILSTSSIGDQLWFKIVGPAACLDGDTLIYDPVDKTTKSVRQRMVEDKKFFVWSRLSNGDIGVIQALPPQEFEKVSLYTVSFKSGKTITVTEGHQFWNGISYVSLQQIYAEQTPEYVSYHLPSISESDLLAHMQDVQRSFQTTPNCRCGCYAYSCLCGAPPQQEADTYLDNVPLPNDVPEHTLEPCNGDDSSFRYKCTVPHFFDFLLILVCRVVSQCRNILGSLLQLFHLFSSSWHTLLWFFQTRINQPIVVCDLLSKFDGIQFQNQKESLKHVTDRHPKEMQSLIEIFHFGKEVNTHQSFHQTSHACGADGMLHQRVLNNAEQPFAQLLVSDSTQPLYESCIEQLTLVSVLDSNQHEQPSYVPIQKVNKRINGSILTEVDEIVKIEYVGEREYYDFHVPETNNYWAMGVFNHNCGKSTLCEALSVAKKYVLPKSTIRGFHSGSRIDGKDHSLIKKLHGMTLIMKDGDTLLQSPNLPQILSEGRDAYDRVSRTSYRTDASTDYNGVDFTWLLCGTSSLRQLDTSELGERFLDVVIMEKIDEEVEDEILERCMYKAASNVMVQTGTEASKRQSPDMTLAMQLTGGYVEYLRENAGEILGSLEFKDASQGQRIISLGKFVAYMRARPSKSQNESADREMATRLVSTLTRSAKCIAGVLNETIVSEESMKRTARIAMDTGRGKTLDIVHHLYSAEPALEVRTLSMYTGRSEDEIRMLLRFMKQIGIVKLHTSEMPGGPRGKPMWTLTDRVTKLYEEVRFGTN